MSSIKFVRYLIYPIPLNSFYKKRAGGKPNVTGGDIGEKAGRSVINVYCGAYGLQSLRCCPKDIREI